MADDNASALQKRQSLLFERKSLLHAFWQECAYNFYPERADFTQERVLGEEFAAHLFDSAPVIFRRDLGNAFSSMLRPRGQPWFKTILLDDDEELSQRPHVAAWLDFVTRRQRALMYQQQASFTKATKAGDHDFAAFGNCVLTAETALDKSGARHLIYRDWHLRDCAWAEDNFGIIDTMFRKIKLTARQYRKDFPEAILPRAVAEAEKRDPDQQFEICHVMLPADEYDYYQKPKGLRAPYASIYYDCAEETLLRERPSRDFRYVVPRWQRALSAPYAVYYVSPAAICSLSDARGMQVMARVLLEAGEKQIDPPMKATEKAVRGEVNLFAGGITWVDKEYDEKLGAALEPILLAKNTGLGVELLDRTTGKLKDAWYLTRLTLPSQAKTAFETAQLVEEFIRANIPLFEPLETEYNGPLLETTGGLLLREGAFGPPELMPKELRGRQLGYGYSNPLQDAIEKNKVNQANTVVGLLAEAGKLDPNAVQRIDVGEMVADATRGSGAPANWLRDPDQLKAQQMAAQQQQTDASGVLGAITTAGQAADVVNKAAQASAALQQQAPPAQPVYGP